MQESQHPLFNQNWRPKTRLRHLLLQLMGLREKRVIEKLSGRKIAVVGNAQSLFNQGLGEKIESHDIIIRLNHGWVHDRENQGKRTDMLATTAKVPENTIRAKFKPDALLWLSPYAKVPGYSKELIRCTHFLTRRRWHSVYRSLDEKARPSTGFILLWWLNSAVDFRALGIFGFDFGRTPTYYTGERAAPVHDFRLEEKVIGSWVNPEIRIF